MDVLLTDPSLANSFNMPKKPIKKACIKPDFKTYNQDNSPWQIGSITTSRQLQRDLPKGRL